ASRVRRSDLIAGWVRRPGGQESFAPKPARVAAAARAARVVGAVARDRERIIDAELESALDDLGLRERDERRVDRELASFHAALRRGPREALERGDEFRSTIRIAAVVDRVHADHDLVRVENLGPRERETQEYGVARGHVRDRDAGAAALGDRDSRVGERG